MEPYPTPNLVEQNLLEILNKISFVDKIVFGKLNYNVESTAYSDNDGFYERCAHKVVEFCKKHKIDCHVKFGTQKIYKKRTEKIFQKGLWG